jgi:hypothetical protein
VPGPAQSREQQALRDQVSGLKEQLAAATAVLSDETPEAVEQLRAALAAAVEAHAFTVAGLQSRLDVAETELSDVKVRRGRQGQRRS